jgi:hypothetical protein
VLATVHVTQNEKLEQQQTVFTHICSGQLLAISPIWRKIFNPKYLMEFKSRPHCCTRGRSMLTEFLHGSGVRWEWWGESILHVDPTAEDFEKSYALISFKIFNVLRSEWLQNIPRLGIFLNNSCRCRVTILPIFLFVHWSPSDTK